MSADFPVGVPFNIAGYSLLLHMFAAQANMKPAKFIHTFGDAHIYEDQVDGVKELLARVDDPNTEIPALPTLRIRPHVNIDIRPSLFGHRTIDTYKFEDFELLDYTPLKPQIDFPVAV